MPSYRYTRGIEQKDLEEAPKPEYTGKQKAGNWWHYHWKLVLICVGAALIILLFVRDMLSNVPPDVTVGIVTPYALPDEVTTALSDALAPLAGDLNGDGKTLAMVEVYTIDLREDAGEGAATGMTDPYAQMAGVTRLMAGFETGECLVLMCDPDQAQAYQDAYGLFGEADGAMAPEGGDVEALTRAFADLPGLAGQTFALQDGSEHSLAEVFGTYRVGLRALDGTKLEGAENGPERWKQAKELLVQLG